MLDPHANAKILHAGTPLKEADSALILIHGRGATAASILDLAAYIGRPGMAFFAPKAEGNVWYPYSFLEEIGMNEPYLTSALKCVGRLVAEIAATGMKTEKLAIGGFSQGACLTLEYCVRNPSRYGAILGLSGGVIGPPGTKWNETGSLGGTPAFVGCSDVDFHIPVERVHESVSVLQALGAVATERIYPGMGHTVNDDEIRHCREILLAI